MGSPCKLVRTALLSIGLAAGLAACATTTSNSFKGEQHDVAQVISNFQSDAKGADEQRICSDDLAASLVARLNRARGGCQEAIKRQLGDVDNYELTIHSIQIAGTSARPTSTASVSSTYSGKIRPSTLVLVKEGGKWRISGVQ